MAFYHLLPISPLKTSLAIQISGALFLLINLIFVKKIAETLSKNPYVPYLAVTLTAFYTPINNWGLQGMEVSLLLLLLNAAIWLSLRERKNQNFSPWPYLALGIGTLVRIDMVVPFIVILAYSLIVDRTHRRYHLLWGLSLLLAFILGQTLFRWFYYGELLPNTYYLKMSGIPLLLRIKRGVFVLFKFAAQMNWVLFLLPFTVLLYRTDRATVLITVVLLGQIAYSVYVGGDAWEHKGGSNRYISLAMPLFFILLTFASEQVWSSITTKSWLPFLKPDQIANWALVLFTVGSMVNFNYLINTRDLERWALLRQPNFVAGNKEDVRIAVAVKKATTPKAKIAVVTAGAIPYFSERPSIDLLGKNDPYIAHQPSHIPSGLDKVRPGHLKWDYHYSIGRLKPDMIVQLWGDTRPAMEYIEKDYTVVEIDDLLFSARTDSPNILWGNLETQP